MKRKVLFWGWYSDYDLLCIDGLSTNYSIFNVSMSKFTRGIIYFSGKIHSKVLYRIVTRLVLSNLYKKVDDGAAVVFSDDILYYPELHSIKGKVDKVVVFRNKIKSQYIQSVNTLKDNGYRLYTFDENDKNRFEIKYSNQYLPVLFDFDDSRQDTNDNAIFLGLDKGRKKGLKKLANKLEMYGISSQIYIIDDNKGLFRKIKKNGVSYNCYINMMLASKYIIDFNSVGQVGMTLRVLESCFYKKKLITNNVSLVKSELYIETNILIVTDEVIIGSVDGFLNTPFVELPNSTLEKYTAEYQYHEILCSLGY